MFQSDFPHSACLPTSARTAAHVACGPEPSAGLSSRTSESRWRRRALTVDQQRGDVRDLIGIAVENPYLMTLRVSIQLRLESGGSLGAPKKLDRFK
jgi:hypothetical protein